jgi:hypothetical protein
LTSTLEELYRLGLVVRRGEGGEEGGGKGGEEWGRGGVLEGLQEEFSKFYMHMQMTDHKSETLKSDMSSKQRFFAATDALPHLACGPDIGQLLKATGLPGSRGCSI